jgi:BirA family biotin operon repressor/biotin-[acetyl-CoA-carboxylase] ligase
MTQQGGIEWWGGRIEETLRAIASPVFDRVVALDEVGSTQDAAQSRHAGRPGLIVVASRQSSGRGRLGRKWVHAEDLGLAMTFVLAADALRADRLSIAAGLASAMAVDDFAAAAAPVGVRWPNDVVESEPRPGGGRKLAGVLVEVRDGMALLGIGVNVNQLERDWGEELRERVVSVREVGGTGEMLDRCDVACAVVRALHRTLAMAMTELIPAWLARDVLRGSVQRFVCEGRSVAGVVESLEPTGEIVVRTEAGERVRLPALITSMVK